MYKKYTKKLRGVIVSPYPTEQKQEKIMKKTMLSLVLLSTALCAWAQQPEKLPLDTNVRYGQLENGLTYYIRHNEQPKQRCEFHIAQAVGAVLEEDDQNGLAHFLEHMAFNGTEHFPGKGIINYFESVGVNFGGNINAYTSIDETVYRLSDVPTYREGIVDSALLVLHDWACGLLLLPEEIDDERGVIREEWRTGRTADRRLWKEIRALKYPGSQYAKRDVIGDTAVINNFAYDALRAYYKKWYGPDNQAIVVVGDIDVDAIEAKIKALWADVPARVNRGERPLYTVSDNTAPLVAIVLDPEAQNTRIELEYKHAQLPVELQNTDQAYLLSMVNGLISDMLDNRFSELALDPNASFMGAGSYYGEIVKLKDAFVTVSIPKEGRETEALNDLLVQLEKMDRYGFTSAELERVKTDYLSRMEKSYNERNSRRNRSIAQECIRNFEDHEPMPGIEWEYRFAKSVLPLINVDWINKIAKDMIHENPTIAITGPKKEGVNIPTEEQILSMLRTVHEEQIEAPKEEAVDTVLVKKAPKAGKIRKTAHNDALGTTEWTLSNGVRVIVKPTEFKQDEIRLFAYSKGGESLIATEDLYAADLATSAVSLMGLGDFSANNLQKALTGKTASASTSINSNTETMSGSSSVRDFETMLQLIYLQFTAPRRDEEAFQTLVSLMHNQLLNKDKNPKAAFSDSVQLFSSNHSERTTIWNTERLEMVSLDQCLRVYKERFANPADFTFVLVGNIDPTDKATRQKVCQWIGGLKTTKAREEMRDNGVRVPLGIQRNYFTREMETTTASNRIQYTSYDMPYTLANDLNMEMIGRILSTRYLESIREREGGSYGVGCAGGMYIKPVNRAYLIMQFDTDPKKQSRLMEIIHEEVQTIIDNGPLANDLSKEKECMLKDFQEDLEKNSYWETIIYLYNLYGLDYLADYRNAVNAITAETIQSTLRQLVSSGNMFEVVMSPAE